MKTATFPKHEPKEAFCLTPMQRGMLVDSLRAGRVGVYVQQLVCTFHEPLDVSRFRAAWRRLVHRHAALRTSLQIDGRDEPVQEVWRRIPWEMNESDWREIGIPEAERRLEAYLREDRRRGFDLQDAPLWRLRLFRLADADYRLAWTSHHALFDGRSRVILLRELLAIYDAIGAGASLSLEPARSFGDHVRWLTGRDFSGSREYWRDRLRGFRGATSLPDDNSGPGSDDGESHATVEISLTDACTRALEDVASQCDATLNSILQGAWALVLSFCSGPDDVVFGATRACRRTSVSGAESIVGLLINTLPVRARIRGSESLSDWLRDLRSQWIALREHELVALADVQAWSEVPPGSPLFESIVVFEKLRLEESLRKQGGAWANRAFRLRGLTNYPIVVAGYGGVRLLVEITIDRRRFADLAIARIKDRLQTVLEGIARGPRQTLAEIPMISQREKEALVVDWNATATCIPRDASIPQLFEAQAARSPHAVAVVFDGRKWTYEELNVWANRLAHRLRALGVGFEAPVAICAERSPEMIAGILGTLKAGGAYVPLDPAFPHERLRFILSDTKAPLVLAQRCLVSQVPADLAKVLCLDTDAGECAIDADANPSCPATFDSLAYIMYTSGSTGIPKGVAVAHRGIIRLVFGVDYVQLGSSRRILHLASPAFDAATFELWGSLLRGGRCVVVPGRAPALDVLERALRVHAVDTLFLTTALFHAVIDESAGMLGGVKQLLVGGEVLSVDHVRRALTALPDTAIIHVYGPTETTTFATSYRIPRAIPPDARSLPIGLPIGNTSVYLLDPLGRPVPVGMRGELYIGGPGVARGYWNRPELTAERFVRDPFDDQPRAHLYRTGDLGRRRPDGNIEFLGRLDDQVKVRGFRIELGEVEAALRRHRAVRDTVVVPVDEPGGVGRRLVAYVVVQDRRARSSGELSDFLKTIVPEYMVPSAFVFLDELPLTSSGKVDRRNLPAPGGVSIDPQRIVTARTPVEASLSRIFADLLGRDRVGVDDDFFLLGGHSLLAMQAVSRAREALRIDLPLTSLFEKPTVAGLAAAAEALVRAGRLDHEPPMLRAPRPGPLPLLASHYSVWDLHRRYPGRPLVNPSRAYRLSGPLSVEALRDALATLVERHESLRTRFVEIDGSPMQIIGGPGGLDLAFVDLSRLPEPERLAEVERHFENDAPYRFDLAHDLLVRPRLLRLSAQDHVLILVFSHMAMDGWSLSIFNRELSALYDAYSTGRRFELPELALQPADVACWERRYFQTAEAIQQVAYWRNHLPDGALAPGIRRDGAAMDDGDFRCACQSLIVPKNIVEGMRELGRQEGCTLPMTSFAALNALVHELTGQEDIRVGTPLAARNRPEVEAMVGCFRKRMILRTDLSGRPTFRALLARVRDVSIGAYLHLNVSPETVFPERGVDHPAHWSRVPINFNFIERLGSSLELPGVAISSIERRQVYNWVDLDLFVFQAGNGLRVEFRSRRSLFTVATIKQFLEAYGFLLRRVVSESNQRLAGIRVGNEPVTHL